MKIASARAKRIARRLLRENRRGRTWREIAERDYRNQIHYATLCKFAKSEGEYIPSDEKVQMSLGLLRAPRRFTPRWMNHDDKTQSWYLWMKSLQKGMHDTAKEQANAWRK